jgi:beta-glucosidase
MITLHHFTNPLWFRDMDAWLNPESPEIFAPYSRKIAEALSEYDVIWNTINEPMVVVAMGYLFGNFPPEIRDYGKAITAAKHLLMTHGQASVQIREVYDELGIPQPQIAPVLSMSHFEPYNPENEEDIELAAYYDNLYNHQWLEGVMTSSLPMDEGQSYKPLDNSADFIGVNYYSRVRVSSELDFLAGEEPPKDPNLERCEGLDWEMYPEGYYPTIKTVWNHWKTPIFLTENGIGATDDSLKRRYLLTHLQQVHRAIQDGMDIRGYLIWSLTDNFEWAEGFSSHFGLVEINYDTQERIPRESAYMFRDIIENNGLLAEMQEKHLI